MILEADWELKHFQDQEPQEKSLERNKNETKKKTSHKQVFFSNI